MKLHKDLKKALGPLSEAALGSGARLYAVGGCVRDALLGRVSTDLDIAVEGDADAVAASAAKALGGETESFGRFGTVRLELPSGARIDLARTRKETYEKPAALPRVSKAAIVEDLKRRDLSVNAMARPLEDGKLGDLLDPFGGKDDLERSRLRLLHDKSLIDDPTRIFRAARYGARLSLKATADTARLIEEAVGSGVVSKLSRERVRQELMRILGEESPAGAFARLKRYGVLSAFHPDFRFPKGTEKAQGAGVRLGVCAISMSPPRGEELLESLPLEHHLGAALKTALKAAVRRSTPREPLGETALAVLGASFPKAPKTAFGPSILRGEDLKDFGLKPGPRYADILDRALRAQWQGAIKSRKDALSWLKKAVPTKK